MRTTLFITLLLCLVMLLTGILSAQEGTPMAYPVMTQVVFTDSDGNSFDPVDPVELIPGEKYTITPYFMDDSGLGEDEPESASLPFGYILFWEVNFGEIVYEEPSLTEVGWIAPDDPGDIVFSVRMESIVGYYQPPMEKTFRVWVGKANPWPEYVEGIALVRFQEWCDPDCIETWVKQLPALGIDRELSEHTNLWRIKIDPGSDIYEAVRQINWWPTVVSAEPDTLVFIPEQPTFEGMPVPGEMPDE